MQYAEHFKPADDMIAHLDSVVNTITDPFVQSRYVGFVAVAAVTVYELAVKEIFVNFALHKNKVFGTFTRAIFNRVNGRIALRNDIKKTYLPRFGDKYLRRFSLLLDRAENDSLTTEGMSVVSSYGNLITWRNQFAHEGNIPSNPTYQETTRAYRAGKQVIHCLANAMTR